MKKSILFVAAMVLMAFTGISQNTYNLVIFSEDGLPFYAFVNGIRQNDKPETNIKVTGLNSEVLNMRVEFTDASLPKLKQNMMPEPGFEHTVNIKRNVKKVVKLQYFGKVALADAPQSSASTVAYHTSENPVSNGGATTQQYNTSTTASDNGGNATTTTYTTSTTTRVGPANDNVSVNINVGGANLNMDVKGLDNGGTTYSSTSSTVTSSSSSSSSSYNHHPGRHDGHANTTQNAQTATAPATASGCSAAMSTASYNQLKKSVEEKPFSDTKMSTAKIATKNSCLSAEQIKGICSLFSMDDDRLAYAKYAYNYCVDKANFYRVSEVFSFSSTTDELNKFLESN